MPGVPRSFLSVGHATVERMETRHCPGCRAARVVEQPPCEDGHIDCPEWVCTECGTAIVFGWLTDDVVNPSRRSSQRRGSAA
jgi:hypothetical protein